MKKKYMLYDMIKIFYPLRPLDLYLDFQQKKKRFYDFKFRGNPLEGISIEKNGKVVISQMSDNMDAIDTTLKISEIECLDYEIKMDKSSYYRWIKGIFTEEIYL